MNEEEEEDVLRMPILDTQLNASVYLTARKTCTLGLLNGLRPFEYSKRFGKEVDRSYIWPFYNHSYQCSQCEKIGLFKKRLTTRLDYF